MTTQNDLAEALAAELVCAGVEDVDALDVLDALSVAGLKLADDPAREAPAALHEEEQVDRLRSELESL